MAGRHTGSFPVAAGFHRDDPTGGRHCRAEFRKEFGGARSELCCLHKEQSCNSDLLEWASRTFLSESCHELPSRSPRADPGLLLHPEGAWLAAVSDSAVVLHVPSPARALRHFCGNCSVKHIGLPGEEPDRDSEHTGADFPYLHTFLHELRWPANQRAYAGLDAPVRADQVYVLPVLLRGFDCSAARGAGGSGVPRHGFAQCAFDALVRACPGV
mmetsp:Transcript_64300/g.153514  ORF Transcript_64300/g.153514 Transcript_64300/m.153514 type:complete len:214 (+) Transcript_64300:1158-1799(+)